MLIPVKSTAVGKSRLGIDPTARARIARALATDTVIAVRSATRVARVLLAVERDDDGALLAAATDGAPLLVHRVHAHGLNESLVEAVASLPRPTGPVALLPADLPSLAAAELDGALVRAAAHPLAVVTDRQGVGTTLLAARRADLLAPHYGADSLAAHLAAGAIQIDVPATSGLRRDVDVVADLCDATGAATVAERDRWASNVTCG